MKISLRKLAGALLVVFGYILAVNVGPKLSDEYVQLGVTVIGAVGIVAGVVLILKARKQEKATKS